MSHEGTRSNTKKRLVSVVPTRWGPNKMNQSLATRSGVELVEGAAGDGYSWKFVVYIFRAVTLEATARTLR